MLIDVVYICRHQLLERLPRLKQLDNVMVNTDDESSSDEDDTEDDEDNKNNDDDNVPAAASQQQLSGVKYIYKAVAFPLY